MSLLTRRRILAAAIESAEGTAEAITVADAGILAFDVKFDPDVKIYKRNATLATLSILPSIPGQRAGRVKFKAELKGNGASYAANAKPAIGKFLQGCGFGETIVAGTSVTYAPASSSLKTLTMWVYEDGIVKKLKGCRGTVKFTGKTGEPFIAEFDFLGVYDAVADLTMVSPTYESTIPPVLLGNSFTVDSYAAIINSISIDMSNQLELRDNMSAAAGYASALITGRTPNGSIDPEMTTVATYDWHAKLLAGTPVALTTGIIGATQYNRYTVTAPKLCYTGVGEGERKGLVTGDIMFDLAMNTGDDEISIAFT